MENEAGKGFVNQAQKGALKIIKTSSDGKIEGFSFRVTGPNGYVGVFTTDKNGEIIIDDLRIGEYVVSEVSDGASSAYVLPADKTASVLTFVPLSRNLWQRVILLIAALYKTQRKILHLFSVFLSQESYCHIYLFFIKMHKCSPCVLLNYKSHILTLRPVRLTSASM